MKNILTLIVDSKSFSLNVDMANNKEHGKAVYALIHSLVQIFFNNVKDHEKTMYELLDIIKDHCERNWLKRPAKQTKAIRSKKRGK